MPGHPWGSALAVCGLVVGAAACGGDDDGRVTLNWYVTPRVHARHHARGVWNFGSTLSICDRVFGTFAAPEASGPNDARDGLDHLGHGRLAGRAGDAKNRLTVAPEQDQRRGPALGL